MPTSPLPEALPEALRASAGSRSAGPFSRRGGGRASALAALCALGATALAGCAGDDGGASGDGGGASAGTAAPGDCITDFDPGQDYFPDKSVIEHAENFTLRYENSYQILTVNEPYPEGDPESYVLVKCGAPAPELGGGLADAPQITVPVDSLYSASTTHLPLLTETGTLDVLSGVGNGSYVSSAEVRALIEEGAVAEYAASGELDAEQVIAAGPDVLMTGGNDDPQYPKLRQAGIAVVANAEWLEATPLGRAEWVKAMAALTGAEREAGALFDTIEGDYLDTAGRAAEADAPAAILPGSMYQGTWSMPAGGSYAATLIRDAGGTYPWADESGTGSLQLTFEAVYAEAGDAPRWLTMENWTTVDDALAADERYAELAAMGDGGEVWTNTRSLGPEGGNDYWERGVLRPDLVLGDLLAIFHPELAPDHAFTFYQPVPAA